MNRWKVSATTYQAAWLQAREMERRSKRRREIASLVLFVFVCIAAGAGLTGIALGAW